MDRAHDNGTAFYHGHLTIADVSKEKRIPMKRMIAQYSYAASRQDWKWILVLRTFQTNRRVSRISDDSVK